MPTDTIKWIEINWQVLDTINDNRSIIGSTEVVDSLESHHCWLIGWAAEAHRTLQRKQVKGIILHNTLKINT